MGMPLARNLLAAGMPTTVWNRTRSKAEPLAADGAHLADSVAEAAADVVLSVLPDVPQLRSLLDEEALAALGAAEIGRASCREREARAGGAGDCENRKKAR